MSPILSVVPSLERAFLSLVWRSNGQNKVQLSPIKAYTIIDLVFNDPTRQALRGQFAKLTRHDFSMGNSRSIIIQIASVQRGEF